VGFFAGVVSVKVPKFLYDLIDYIQISAAKNAQVWLSQGDKTMLHLVLIWCWFAH